MSLSFRKSYFITWSDNFFALSYWPKTMLFVRLTPFLWSSYFSFLLVSKFWKVNVLLSLCKVQALEIIVTE